nr:MAG TPA: hypothetical protein [Caudoviricetes sp.]
MTRSPGILLESENELFQKRRFASTAKRHFLPSEMENIVQKNAALLLKRSISKSMTSRVLNRNVRHRKHAMKR